MRRLYAAFDKARVAGHEGFGGITGQFQTAFADVFHGPPGRVAAAISHTGQIVHQGGEKALPLAQGRLGRLPGAQIPRHGGKIFQPALFILVGDQHLGNREGLAMTRLK